LLIENQELNESRISKIFQVLNLPYRTGRAVGHVKNAWKTNRYGMRTLGKLGVAGLGLAGAAGLGGSYLFNIKAGPQGGFGSNQPFGFGGRRRGLDVDSAATLADAAGTGIAARRRAQMGTTGRERAAARNIMRGELKDMKIRGEDLNSERAQFLRANLGMMRDSGGGFGRMTQRPSSTERAAQNAEFLANYENSQRLRRLRDIEKHSPELASSGAFEPLRAAEREAALQKDREDVQARLRQARADEVLKNAYAKQGRSYNPETGKVSPR
jgi:hypothetical protein